jgi:hypothetical protein
VLRIGPLLQLGLDLTELDAERLVLGELRAGARAVGVALGDREQRGLRLVALAADAAALAAQLVDVRAHTVEPGAQGRGHGEVLPS